MNLRKKLTMIRDNTIYFLLQYNKRIKKTNKLTSTPLEIIRK